MRTMAPWCVAALVILVAGTAAAQDMPHEELAFGCSKCHQSTDDRGQIDFDHNELDFRLEGHHQVVDCARCHDLADFARADEACATCHTDVHQGRLDPDCGTCHSPSGWDVIDHYGAHSRTAFQLMGAHMRLDCDACHPREIIAERSQLYWDCYDCHQADYEATVFPDHAGFGFDTRCETCHTQFAWRPSTPRDHAGAFPIFSGNHAGEWDSCSDCHVNPGDFGDFSCLECHKHDQNDMDEEHDDVNGYVYNSHDCYACHPTGSED